MCGAGEWKVLVDEYAAPQHPAARHLKPTQNTRPTHAPAPTNRILEQNSTWIHSTLVQTRCCAPRAWGGVLMLSGKDIFRQGKEIVRIALYKCHIGSHTQKRTKMESKKKNYSAQCAQNNFKLLTNPVMVALKNTVSAMVESY